MKELNKKDQNTIQKQVIEHLAPIHEGNISLDDITRLFDRLGTAKEIEKSIDQLVDNSTVLKIEENHQVHYIFQGIARRFGEKWRQEVTKLQGEIEKTGQEINVLNDKLKKTQELKETWQDGWGNDDISKIAPTIVGCFFNEVQKKALSQINLKTEAKKKYLVELSTVKQKLALSFKESTM
jgi:hypothetical protein